MRHGREADDRAAAGPCALSAPYARIVTPLEADEFIRSHAPEDVQATVAWLQANGYSLSSQCGDNNFGARFVFVGAAEVHITVDRSQWFLDVACEPGARSWQYDLLLVARSGQTYGTTFPAESATAVERQPRRQVPDGVSWYQTLPDVLGWVRGPGVGEAIERASRQRFALMWSRK